ncbi:MAG: hypothetical protein KGL39_09960 [Patescibacteria group bacterium]|nr:hypothetical protein [Patescibacteria group bacterium]
MILLEIPQKTVDDELDRLENHFDQNVPTSRDFLKGAIVALLWIRSGAFPPADFIQDSEIL